MRAYRELELGGMLETHQGTGTFISNKKIIKNSGERERQLTQLANEFAARAGAAGFHCRRIAGSAARVSASVEAKEIVP